MLGSWCEKGCHCQLKPTARVSWGSEEAVTWCSGEGTRNCQLVGVARVSELVLLAIQQLQGFNGAERRLREQVQLDGVLFPSGFRGLLWRAGHWVRRRCGQATAFMKSAGCGGFSLGLASQQAAAGR